jgi:transcriptional regulator GlxA family with amidase domain
MQSSYRVAMNVVVYLPGNFYASVGAFVCELFLTLNAVRGRNHFDVKFISKHRQAITRSGIRFPVSKLAPDKIDLLVFLAGHSMNLLHLERELDDEIDFAQRTIERAIRDKAVIAGTCSASLLMAKAGLLDNRRATVSWWARAEAKRLFPQVKWDPSRIISRHKNIYTSGGVYSAMDLLTSVLVDMGYEADTRQARKLLVSPPVRQLQSPYETEFSLGPKSEFQLRLARLVEELGVDKVNLDSIARRLVMTPKTLARRFKIELDVTPGKWLQTVRISKAREYLEASALSVGEICDRIGYGDQASFTRLFGRITGLTPTEYRRQMRL